MKHPLGVTILAVLGLTTGLAEIVWAMTLGWGTDRGIRQEVSWITAIAPIARLLLGLVYALIGIGLWRLRRWARGVVILLSALAIGTMAIAVVWAGRLNGFSPLMWLMLPVAGFYVLCLSYMFTRNVRQAFSA